MRLQPASLEHRISILVPDRLWEFLGDQGEYFYGFCRPVLIAVYVRDLIVIGHPLKIIGVSDIGGRWEQPDIALRGGDGVVVTAVLILAEGGHQNPFPLPLRIGILLFELGEF